VEFFNGQAKLGEDLTAPYGFVWANVPAGNYSLTAKATDNQNATTTSIVVGITVGNTNKAPAVSLISPANNAKLPSGSSIIITANANDSDGTISKVEFFSGTTKLGEDLTSPYSFTYVNVPAGTYSLTARATDNQNAITTSGTIAVVLANPNKVPVVSLTNPADHSSFTAGSTITITANATDSDGTIGKVEFFSGTTKLGEDLTTPYSFTWVNVPAGNYSLTAKGTDNQNAVATSSAIGIIVGNANMAPAVSLTSPANQSRFIAGSSITISANASDTDGTISKVEFFSGATRLGEVLAPPYNFAWKDVPAGNYSVTAKATDNQNAITISAAIAIIVDANRAPVVRLTSPAGNLILAAGSSIAIMAEASDPDGAVSKVEFFSVDTKLGEDMESPYSFLWVNVPPGNYTLTAKATDNQNAITTSEPVTVRITGGEIAVYPNPATDRFTLHYSSRLSQQAQIGVLDMASRLVKQMEVTLNDGLNDIAVDTAGMGNGTYIVSLLTADGQKSSKRLMVLGK
jgi:hypothetical protein